MLRAKESLYTLPGFTTFTWFLGLSFHFVSYWEIFHRFFHGIFLYNWSIRVQLLCFVLFHDSYSHRSILPSLLGYIWLEDFKRIMSLFTSSGKQHASRHLMVERRELWMECPQSSRLLFVFPYNTLPAIKIFIFFPSIFKF